MISTQDRVPDNRNTFAFVIGRIFHPFFVCILTIFAVLSELPLDQALRWSTIVISIILLPGLVANYYVQFRYKRYLYQRETRGPLYLIGWLSVVLCLILLLVMSAPRILIASLITLVLWTPPQLLITMYVTKISAHAGVLAGCTMALLLTGKLTNPLLLALVLIISVVTMWSRIATRNHTFPQIVMGYLLGALPVLLVFPLMLP